MPVLDPRLYRIGLIAVVVAAIVVAFSVYQQDGPLGATLAPVAFNGQNAEATMTTLATKYPSRPPGSAADRAIADGVDSQLTRYGFAVSRDFFTAQTVTGRRRLENVFGVRPGLVSGSIVIVAHRDATGRGAPASASGTAVLLELARVLSGETQHRTIVLASTSGSAGAAGTAQLARTLAPPVDAVIALGDLAGTHVRQPVVVPWSGGQQVAPTMLRNTVAAAISAQAAMPPGKTSLAAQIAHLAFPLSVSEQGPFGARGDPAVLLSLSGERPPPADQPTSLMQISALGRSLMQTVNALDDGSSVPAASAYLIWNGKVVPAWAIRLLVLALMLPVLIATIDGVARVRRRGNPLGPWIVWVLASAVPFALVIVMALAATQVGLIAAPPEPLSGDGVSLRGGGIAVLVVAGIAVVAGFALLRPRLVRFFGPRRSGSRHGNGGADARRMPYGLGAPAAVMVVLCVASLLIWIGNPYAAMLLIPALHAWLWAVNPDMRIPAPIRFVLAVAGLAAPALIGMYYCQALGLGFIGGAWASVLLLAAGVFSPAVALAWSVVLGCFVSVGLIVVRAAPQHNPHRRLVTIRGPLSYAGPGSLGGTQSALRR